MNRFVVLCAVAFTFTACATPGMDQAQCQTADWRAIGHEDGSRGLGGAALGTRRKNCAPHGLAPDFANYMDGHAKGIAAFCRPQNGYQLGKNGYRYNGVCPQNLEGAFLDAHADGFGLYQRRAAVRRLSNLIDRKLRRSRKIEQLMAKKTTALIGPTTLPARRLSLGVELKQLTEERIDIERSIGDLQVDLEQARKDYRGYQDNLAQR